MSRSRSCSAYTCLFFFLFSCVIVKDAFTCAVLKFAMPLDKIVNHLVGLAMFFKEDVNASFSSDF